MSSSFVNDSSDNDDSFPGNGNAGQMATQQLVDFTSLKQGEDERVLDFYARVVKAIDELENLVPGGQFELPTPAYPRALTGVPEFSKLHPKNKRNAAVRLVKHGAQQAFNFIGTKIFVSGLRPSLQEEVIKVQPKTLYSAFESAQNVEKVRQAGRRLPKRGLDQVLDSAENGNSRDYDYDDTDEELEFDEDGFDGDGYDENRSGSPHQSFDDIGLDDSDLRKISTKELNSLLRKKKIDKDRAKEIKTRRRTLKNRGYAANCRAKRDTSDDRLRMDIGRATREKAEEVSRIDKAKEKNHRLEAELKRFNVSDQEIVDIQNGDFSSVQLTKEEELFFEQYNNKV